MTPERFLELDEHFMKQVNLVMHSKGEHYHDKNRFDNFIEAAQLGDTDPMEEMKAALRKHTVAFHNMFKRYKGHTIPMSTFIEHGGDIINYIRLIYGWLNKEEKDYVGCDLSDCHCHVPGETCKKDCVSTAGGRGEDGVQYSVR